MNAPSEQPSPSRDRTGARKVWTRVVAFVRFFFFVFFTGVFMYSLLFIVLFLFAFDDPFDKLDELQCGPWVKTITPRSSGGPNLSLSLTVKAPAVAPRSRHGTSLPLPIGSRTDTQPALKELIREAYGEAEAYCDSIGARRVEFVDYPHYGRLSRVYTCTYFRFFEAQLVQARWTQEYRCVAR